MPYESGETPEIGDHVRHRSGKLGKITAVMLNQGHLRGEDAVRVMWDDGSVGIGNALAAEFSLVSRQDPSEVAHFQSHCPTCKEPKPTSANRDYLKVALEKSEVVQVVSTCGHGWNLPENERKNLQAALKENHI
jgi:hypothetical protein